MVLRRTEAAFLQVLREAIAELVRAGSRARDRAIDHGRARRRPKILSNEPFALHGGTPRFVTVE